MMMDFLQYLSMLMYVAITTTLLVACNSVKPILYVMYQPWYMEGTVVLPLDS